MTFIAARKIALFALPVAILAMSACTHHTNVTDLPPGNYERTTSSTNSNGTDIKKTTNTDVRVDRYGNKSAVVSTETTTDPKGLMNKSKTSSTTKVYQND